MMTELHNFYSLLFKILVISSFLHTPPLEFIYGTQYHPIPPVEKDSYVIENDLYVRI
jgi:hypothetical protein